MTEGKGETEKGVDNAVAARDHSSAEPSGRRGWMGGGSVNSPKGLAPHQAAALQEFASAVRDLLGSRLIALKLFGSHVRGEAAADSDLDVLVAVEEASPALENAILDLAFQVNLAHDVYISPRVIARRVFEDPVWRSTPFIRTLQVEGAPLIGDVASSDD